MIAVVGPTHYMLGSLGISLIYRVVYSADVSVTGMGLGLGLRNIIVGTRWLEGDLQWGYQLGWFCLLEDLHWCGGGCA